MLAQRLMRIASVSDRFPATPLSNLSASMRIRCIERLADRPIDWLIIDNGVAVARWRRSILLAGGYSSLIEQLADALEQKRQRHPTSIRRMPKAELSALLGAYLRIMDCPPRR